MEDTSLAYLLVDGCRQYREWADIHSKDDVSHQMNSIVQQ